MLWGKNKVFYFLRVLEHPTNSTANTLKCLLCVVWEKEVTNKHGWGSKDICDTRFQSTLLVFDMYICTKKIHQHIAEVSFRHISTFYDNVFKWTEASLVISWKLLDKNLFYTRVYNWRERRWWRITTLSRHYLSNLSFHTLVDKNTTNHPISSNSHPSATAYKAIHCLKQREHNIIWTKYEAVHPTDVSENSYWQNQYHSSHALQILTKIEM